MVLSDEYLVMVSKEREGLAQIFVEREGDIICEWIAEDMDTDEVIIETMSHVLEHAKAEMESEISHFDPREDWR